MTGIVLVTHNGIGECLVHQAEKIIGRTINVTTVSINYDAVPEQARQTLRTTYAISKDREGLLVLTDLPGATPHNLATAVADEDGARVVSGLNLPMLLKVLNYAHLPPGTLAEKARCGGCEGVEAVQ